MADYRKMYTVSGDLKYIIADVFSDDHFKCITNPNYIDFLKLYGAEEALVYALSPKENGFDLLALCKGENMYPPPFYVDTIFQAGENVTIFIIDYEFFMKNTAVAVANIMYYYAEPDANLRRVSDVIKAISIFYYTIISIAYQYIKDGRDFENDLISSGQHERLYNGNKIKEIILDCLDKAWAYNLDKMNIFLSTVDVIKAIGEKNMDYLCSNSIGFSAYLSDFLSSKK